MRNWAAKKAHQRFCDKLAELELGQVLDIVPNHMAIGAGESLLVGCAGERAIEPVCDWFDIDWNSAEVQLQNKVLIPVLGDQYGKVLASGQIQIEQAGMEFQCSLCRTPVSAVAAFSWRRFCNGPGGCLRDDVLGFIADSLRGCRCPRRWIAN